MAGGEPGPRELHKYLAEGERVLFVLHEHWIRVLEPVVTVVGAAVAVALLDQWIDPNVDYIRSVLIVAWLVLVARLAWKLFEWRRDYFVVTSKRLINNAGILRRKVAMMPLGKVTDMNYVRSPWGRILGYGQFVVESAGQKQAIDFINFVPDSDEVYRAIMNELFGSGSPVKPKAPLPGPDLPVVEPDDPWWTHGD
ncbi:MAG: PH domain-containing protein [Kineosporiaceae bacterium]